MSQSNTIRSTAHRTVVLFAAALVCLHWAIAGGASGQVGVESSSRLQGLIYLEIGPLPGFSRSRAHAVSADGSVVVGVSFSSSTSRAFRWSNGGLQALGGFPLGNPNNSLAYDVSADGQVIVGYAAYQVKRPVRWRSGSWAEFLPHPQGIFSASAASVSASGDQVVGLANLPEPASTRLLVWGLEAGYLDIDRTLCCEGRGEISADGEVVAFNPLDGPTVYRQGEGSEPLPLPAGFENSQVTAIASGGNLFVGTGGLPRRDPVVWTLGSLTSLAGDLPVGKEGSATAISRDGTMIVGEMRNERTIDQTAFLWTAGDGVVSIQEYLRSNGVDTIPWRSSRATDVSDDGRTIVGYSFTESPRRFNGWLVKLPRPCADRLDNDGDGTRDAADSDCDDLTNGRAESQSADPDEDGIPSFFDSCRDTYNPDQTDWDGDGLGDVCDPFPEDPDHEYAQCRVDRDDFRRNFETCNVDLARTLVELSEAQAALATCDRELATCEGALSSALADTDGDGVLDSADQCAGTAPTTSVDQLGCSLAQFCSGRRAPASCNNADWRNDEPLGNPHDCKQTAGVCAPR